MTRTFWSSLETPIGLLTLIANEEHLQNIRFDDALPQGAIGYRLPILDTAAQQLEEYFAGTRKEFDVPLATPRPGFHGTCQATLSRIPYGERRTYAQLADAAGSPRASRAAGTACRTNPFPLIVPCHRVVRSDGQLGHYLGGDAAKRWLLDHEAAVVAKESQRFGNHSES